MLEYLEPLLLNFSICISLLQTALLLQSLLQEAGVSAKARSLDASVSLFDSQAFDETIRRIALYSNLYKQNSE